MSPMEKFVSTGKLESRIREQYWIDKIQVARRDAVMMNGCRAYISPEQQREQNRERACEFSIKYRAEHREELNAKCLIANSKKMTCACGKEHIKGFKSGHLKTKKHIEWVKQNETKSVATVNEPEV